MCVRNLDGTLFEGMINIENGKLNTTDIYIEGSSLLIGADLTGRPLPEVFLVTMVNTFYIGLLLFAFSQPLHGPIMEIGQRFICLVKVGSALQSYICRSFYCFNN